MKKLFILILILSFTSCKNNNFEKNLSSSLMDRVIKNDYKSLQRVINLQLPKSENDCTKLGFKKQKIGSALGIRGFSLYRDFLYISDDLFGNIKKIDITTGQIIKASKILNPEFKDVGDIVVNNDTVLCLSEYRDLIFYLDTNLILTSKKHFRYSTKAFIHCNNNLYIKSDLEENIIHDPYLKQTLSYERNKLDLDSSSYFRMGDKLLLKNRFGVFEVRDTLPQLLYLSIDNKKNYSKKIIFFEDRDSLYYEFFIYNY